MRSIVPVVREPPHERGETPGKASQPESISSSTTDEEHRYGGRKKGRQDGEDTRGNESSQKEDCWQQTSGRKSLREKDPGQESAGKEASRQQGAGKKGASEKVTAKEGSREKDSGKEITGEEGSGEEGPCKEGSGAHAAREKRPREKSAGKEDSRQETGGDEDPGQPGRGKKGARETGRTQQARYDQRRLVQRRSIGSGCGEVTADAGSSPEVHFAQSAKAGTLGKIGRRDNFVGSVCRDGRAVGDHA